VLSEKLANERKALPAFGQLSLPIFFDFDYFVMWSPDDKNIGRVAVPFPVAAILQKKWLLLPRVGSCRRSQDTKCLDFVL
jgi:hypothetical protein